ncbi:uncharacterized protein LOC136096637 [Hydra vulgaris]|uniref:uncharacterized protein LOC136096637 n=1 Tax=Hydra vulgaris TaxID=6087 RepID=UPI0032E9E1FB
MVCMKLTYKHFLNEGIPKSTIFSWYEKYGVKVNQSTISRTINLKTDIKCYKKQKAPLYEKDQQQRAATSSRRLVNKVFHEKDIIMNDEKYFNLSNSNIPGNDIYYTNNKLSAPDNVKYKLKKKFEEKVLVWICISSNGFCEPYIHRSKNSITSNIYVKECMKKRLIPFVREHYKDNNFVFWLDLATAHYANKTENWFIDNSIEFVQKCTNPPNVPLARPNETFWAILSQMVYSDGWRACSIYQLVQGIKRKLNEIKENDPDLLQRLMMSVKIKLRKIADRGVYSIC